MSKNDFEKLSEQDKRVYLFEAKKIAEISDGETKAELFLYDNFYVEAFISMVGRIRRTIHACDHIPAIFRKQLFDRKLSEQKYFSF